MSEENRTEIRGTLNTVNPVCDFCSAPQVIACLHIKPDQIELSESGNPVRLMDDGCWAICNVCKGLLESRDWEGLIQHVMATYARKETIPAGFFYNLLKEWYSVIERLWDGTFGPWTGGR